jgi:hypothetical protein
MTVINQLVKALELLRGGYIDAAYDAIEEALRLLRKSIK